MSSVNKMIGMGHIVYGSVTGSSGTDAALTSNDGSATLTVDGTGQFTVTFGHVFNSAPVVVANVVDATFAATDGAEVAVLRSAATNAVAFDILNVGGSAADGAAVDLDFHFVAMGDRNN